MDKQPALTPSEWQIMELLWAKPQTLMELVSCLGHSIGWSKSTVSTMVHRMADKGLIRFETKGRTKTFYPCISREDVAAQETNSLLSRAYHGSVGLLVSAMVQRKNLSKADIDELYAILKEAEEYAK